jgi:flagellar biosynthesis protein FlhB
MAEAPDKDQQTEAPSQKRKMDAIKDGDILSSKELATFVMMAAAALWLFVAGAWFFGAAKALVRSGLSLDLSDPDRFEPLGRLVDPLGQIILPFCALLLLTIVAALAAQAVLGSLGMHSKLMAFKASRIDPLAGIKRIFGVQGLIELIKATAKVVALGYAAYRVVEGKVANMPGLSATHPDAAAIIMGDGLIMTIVVLTIGLALIAGIDMPVQWLRRNQRLRMTKQQVKEESRQNDGAPELKQAIRARQQEILMSSARKGMADANVVLTNPVHFAVALRYRPGLDAAPVVVARGRGDVAQAIKTLAKEKQVPVLEYPQLARAIYFTTRTGRAVSEDLYIAVAAILAFVFRLDNAMADEMAKPAIDVPPAKRFDPDGRRSS